VCEVVYEEVTERILVVIVLLLLFPDGDTAVQLTEHPNTLLLDVKAPSFMLTVMHTNTMDRWWHSKTGW
jgi:hypothetical protein